MVDASFALTTYVDTSLNTNYYTKTAIDASINTSYYNRNMVDASFALTTYVDTSLNTNYYTKSAIDESFAGIVSTAGNVNITPVTAFNLTTPMSYINGNLDIGTGSNLIGINKDIDVGFHLDISGNLRVSNTITATNGFIGTSFEPSAAGTAITFGNITTTGNITIGASQTTGNLNLGSGIRSATGNIFIGTGASATNTINIGRGNVISIVNGTTPTFTINRPIKPNYTYSITDSSAIGYQVTVNNTSFSNPWNVTTPPIGVMTSALSLTPGVWNLSGYCHLTLNNNTGIDYGLSNSNTAFNVTGTLPMQSAVVNAALLTFTNYWQLNIVYLATANTSINFLLKPYAIQSTITFTRAGIIATRIA